MPIEKADVQTPEMAVQCAENAHCERWSPN